MPVPGALTLPILHRLIISDFLTTSQGYHWDISTADIFRLQCDCCYQIPKSRFPCMLTCNKAISELLGLKQRKLIIWMTAQWRARERSQSALWDWAEGQIIHYRQRNVGFRTETGRALKVLRIMHQSHLPSTPGEVLAWSVLTPCLVLTVQHVRWLWRKSLVKV